MEQNPNDPLFPRDEDDGPAAADGASVPAGRQDGFTPLRRRTFLAVLRRTGCVRDACRAAGVSDSAAYKLRRRDAEFRDQWAGALAIAAGDMEILAWQRAVAGVEEEVWAYGKPVGTRRRRDERLFRILLQASDPNRYGGPGLNSPAAIEKRVRAQIAAETREVDVDESEVEAARRRIARKLERLAEQEIAAGRAYLGEGGRLIPAGYVKAEPGAGAAPQTGAARPGPEPRAATHGAAAPASGAGRPKPEPSAGGESAGTDAPEPQISADSARAGPGIAGP